jgi:predicted SAM-dependent methyltransferase
MIKLHLGCGQRYLEGYINIDYPATEHTVQSHIKADRYADITELTYSSNTIDEVRLHHVFEHFTRTDALALLCRWRDWLKPGGLLRIETPDAMKSSELIASPFTSFDFKQQVMRHLFGSHEAAWAVHCDGWYKEKFITTLGSLGFENIRFSGNKWGALRNVEVYATKSKHDFTLEEYVKAVEKILKPSTVRVKTKDKYEPEGSELSMLTVWIAAWKNAYMAKGC